MDQRLITLPDREEMLKRLISVVNENHLIGGLYPRLLQHAGTKKTASGVVQMIYATMLEYAEASELNEVSERLLALHVPRFAEALAVDDADFLKEVRQFYQLVISAPAP